MRLYTSLRSLETHPHLVRAKLSFTKDLQEAVLMARVLSFLITLIAGNATLLAAAAPATNPANRRLVQIAAQVAAQKADADDDPEMRLMRAEIDLAAARLERAAALQEGEMNGRDLRNDAEKAREKLLITRYSLGEAKKDVAARTAEISRIADAVELRNKTREKADDAEKARIERLAASKEVAAYKAASERLIGACSQRQKAIVQASEKGKDIRTDFEKAAEKFNVALSESKEFQAAVKRLKAARRNAVVEDLALAESASVPLRAALLRVELAAKK
jgi:hypothetical protein